MSKVSIKSKNCCCPIQYFNDKARVLQNCRKLKGVAISIYKDFSKEIPAIRREFQSEMFANRKKKKMLYLPYGTVTCKDRIQEW